MARREWSILLVALTLILITQSVSINRDLQADAPEEAQTLTVGTTYILSTSYQNSTLLANTFILQNPPANSECHWQAYTMVAEKGQTVEARITSNTPISLYVIPDANFSAWRNLNTCGATYAIATIGPATSWFLRFNAPETATYDGIFLNSGSTAASVSLTVFILSPMVTTVSFPVLSTYTLQASFTPSAQAAIVTPTPQAYAIVPAAMLVLVIVMGVIFVLARRRRKPYLQQTGKAGGTDASSEKRPLGYEPLDKALYGGVNRGTSLVLLGPASDERDALVKGFLEAGLKEETPILSMSNSAATVDSMLHESLTLVHLVLCGRQARVASPQLPNVVYSDGLGNLTDLSITISNVLKKLNTGRVGIEILSDVLLIHHSTTTRKWLTGLLIKLKNSNFITLAVLDPSMHSADEVGSVVSLFDGQIDIIQKDVNGKLRRFVIVRRLRDQRYHEDEILLEKDCE